MSLKATPATGTQALRNRKIDLLTMIALLGSLLATSASLGIATFAGYQRGGFPVERTINVILGCAAVLYVHLLPIGWRLLRIPARICAFALWWIGVAVVLYGQVTFLLVSQQHAGNERAASVTVIAVPSTLAVPSGRTRTEIAQDIASTKATLAQQTARRCTGDCTALVARRQTLAARLAALNTEDTEALRHEAEQDRERKRADRADALREMSRVDPVAQVVAARLHTTENLFALIVAVACAVVLEGSAILGWLLVSVGGGRAHGRDLVVGSPEAVATGRENAVATCAAVGSQCDVATVDHPVSEHLSAAVAALAEDARVVDVSGTTAGPDERQLEKIRNAVLAGTLDPTQESIRRLLRCRQPTAGRLNRLYGERYGKKTLNAGSPPSHVKQPEATQA